MIISIYKHYEGSWMLPSPEVIGMSLSPSIWLVLKSAISLHSVLKKLGLLRRFSHCMHHWGMWDIKVLTLRRVWTWLSCGLYLMGKLGMQEAVRELVALSFLLHLHLKRCWIFISSMDTNYMAVFTLQYKTSAGVLYCNRCDALHN